MRRSMMYRWSWTSTTKSTRLQKKLMTTYKIYQPSKKTKIKRRINEALSVWAFTNWKRSQLRVALRNRMLNKMQNSCKWSRSTKSIRLTLTKLCFMKKCRLPIWSCLQIIMKPIHPIKRKWVSNIRMTLRQNKPKKSEYYKIFVEWKLIICVKIRKSFWCFSHLLCGNFDSFFFFSAWIL